MTPQERADRLCAIAAEVRPVSAACADWIGLVALTVDMGAPGSPAPSTVEAVRERGACAEAIATAWRKALAVLEEP